MRCRNGFTLVELLVALCALALLTAFAVPALWQARAAVGAAGLRADLETDLRNAARIAFVENRDIVLCPSLDGQDCSDTTRWETGWISFLDRDEDRHRGSGDPMLRRQGDRSSEFRLRSTAGRKRIVIQPHGGAPAGSNATFTLCDRRGRSHATDLILAPSGGLRAAPTPGAADVACP